MSAATYAYDAVAILRPGRYTAADGREVTLGPADLQRLAAEYDPAWHAAPLNVDHAESGPSLGRVAALSFDGAYLRADLAGVPRHLADQLAAGAYPSRSAELYPAQGSRGPYLRAVALLGAQLPAVKGLPPLPPGRLEPQPLAHDAADASIVPAAHASRTMRLARTPHSEAHHITMRGGSDARETIHETA